MNGNATGMIAAAGLARAESCHAAPATGALNGDYVAVQRDTDHVMLYRV